MKANRSMKANRVIPLLLALLLLCAACSDKSPKESEAPSQPPAATPEAAAPKPTPEPTPTPTPTPEPTPEPPLYRNPLTGEAEDFDVSHIRPYAVMLNNISVSMPQCGVSKADIIYEILAEGGITRMMALFSDISDAGIIGSMRSVRLYYLDISQTYDAILVHAGGSEESYAAISGRLVDSIDGVTGWYGGQAFYRDRSRMDAGYEHSLFTTGELMLNWTEQLGIRTEHDGRFDCGLRFTDDDAPLSGAPAKSVSVDFGGYKTSDFTLGADGKYAMRQYDESYIDGNSGVAPSFTNLLVLYADSSVIDSAGRLAVSLTGSGEGYYARGGSVVDITWSRAFSGSPFEYRLADGSELEFAVGTSYICIVPSSGSTVAFS